MEGLGDAGIVWELVRYHATQIPTGDVVFGGDVFGGGVGGDHGDACASAT